MSNRPVLGNDPFQRGAADRQAGKESPAATPRKPKARKPVKKAAQSKRAARADKPFPQKPKKGGGKSRKKTGAAQRKPPVSKRRPVISNRGLGDDDALNRKELSRAISRPRIGVDPFGLSPAVEARWKPLVEAIYDRWFRVDLSGTVNLPASGGALLVCNHAGAFPWDSLMMKTAIDRQGGSRIARPLIEDFFFHLPFVGRFLNRYGAVRACQDNAERLLARDSLLIVFPEGLQGLGKPYSNRYRLGRFGRGGFVKLALRASVPIIPVAIVGSEEAHPVLVQAGFLAEQIGIPYLPITPTFPWLGPLGLVPLPSKWRVQIGDPIDLSDHGPEAATDRVLVAKVSDKVRSNIQGRLDKLRLKP